MKRVSADWTGLEVAALEAEEKRLIQEVEHLEKQYSAQKAKVRRSEGKGRGMAGYALSKIGKALRAVQERLNEVRLKIERVLTQSEISGLREEVDLLESERAASYRVAARWLIQKTPQTTV